MVKSEIRGHVNFEIKSQFMRELRADIFSGNKNEDAHEHVDLVIRFPLKHGISRVAFGRIRDAFSVIDLHYRFTHSISMNDDDNHNSGTGVRRQAPLARECTYSDFINANPYILKELALMYVRMFPEESNKIEKYVGSLPNMIHKSVMTSKPKTIQDAIEFATELMDKKISTLAERQAKM
uniref:Reverse transcriptase domain-containing protein n=1 Tax=Tanacetum cinerariifolium TaxID=118510 RepID=A0A6L2JH17_TANCI|nr:hypothetical protein [Tanacetum cinerariifolium]